MTTKTSDRLIELLELFGSRRSIWTVELGAERLGISVSNAYRYFRTLANAGYIVGIGTGRYVLGPAVMMLDRQMRLSDPLITSSRSEMRKIAATAPPYSVAILCRLLKGQIICIHDEMILPPQLPVSYERGLPMPLWRGAASKAVMAHLPDRSARSLWSSNQDEVARAGMGHTWVEFRGHLRRMREMEAISTEGELGTPTRGIASPIFDNGQVVGSLGLVLLTDQLGYDDPGLVNIVATAAKRITESFALEVAKAVDHEGKAPA